ncbi:MAG TPA: zinc dependent phospholipase C family protein [Candidatus Acidoferrales bacterium]|nr:zinc dependent phospholipase C family protein [Candidatus Acidoferrales bacterium]
MSGSLIMGLLILLLAPREASAWGPITHLAHGAEVLSNLTILGAGLQRLLQRERLAYLYGCVGADITQAKKYTRAEQAHCHSWRVGWALLAHAQNDTQRAFSYGYLTHLSSDVYSHNHYVPTQLIVSFRAMTLRHVYWEARFDALQDAELRDIVGELRAKRFPECDDLVRDVVSRTLFSFSTDKRIFNGFIAIHDLDQWHKIMRRLIARSRYALPPEIVRRYNDACYQSIVDMLKNGKRADNQTADPTGLVALTMAKDLRNTLKLLARNRRLPRKLQDEIEALNERSELLVGSGMPSLSLTLATSGVS